MLFITLLFSVGLNTFTHPITHEKVIRSFPVTPQVQILNKAEKPAPKQPTVLFVDDDGGQSSNEGVGYETYWLEIISSLGVSCEVFSIKDSTFRPDSNLLKSYTIVIWSEPDYNTSLTADDTVHLLAYLNSGGNLWLSGEDVLYNLESGPGIPSYLYVLGYSDEGCDTVFGVGDTIGDAYVFPLDSISRLTNDPSNNWSDQITIDTNNADSSFISVKVSTGHRGIVGYRVDSAGTTKNGKMFFFGAPFEALRKSDRVNFMSSVFGYFGVTVQSFDLYPVSIMWPKKFSNIDGPNSVIFKLANVSTDTVPDFYAVVRIYDKLSNLVYGDSLLIHGLPANADTTIQLADWSVATKDTFTVYAYSNLSQDSDHSNDTLSRQVYTTHVIVFDDYETGLDLWTGVWDITDEYSYGGDYSFTDTAYANYPDRSVLATSLKDTLQFSSFADAKLSFWTKHYIEAGFDYGYLVLQDLSTGETEILATFNGDSANWYKITSTLGNYTGTQYKLTLKLVSDPGYNETGWFVDEFLIEGLDTDVTPPMVRYRGPDTYTEGVLGALNLPVYIFDRNGVQAETLFYSVEGGGASGIIPDSSHGDTFFFNIPQQPTGSRIDYWVKAVDAGGNAIETAPQTYFQGVIIAYDDGEPEAYYIWNQGDRIASRFEPFGANKFIQPRKLFFYWYTDFDTPPDTVGINLFLEEDTLPSQEKILPSDIIFYPGDQLNQSRPYGFTYVDVPDTSLKIPQPFYVSAENTSPSQYPVFGADQSGSVGNSYYYYQGYWYHFTDEDFMIRVLCDTGTIHYDASLLSLKSPPLIVKPGVYYTPEVNIANISDSGFACVSRLSVDSSGIEVFSSYDTTYLDTGDTLSITYEQWRPMGFDVYYIITARIESSQDQNIFNNTYVETVYSGVPSGQFLLWNPAPNRVFGKTLYSILTDSLGLKGFYTEDLKPYAPYIGNFLTLWATFGVFPDRYILPDTSEVVDIIKSYLNEYKMGMFLEGTRCWYYDPRYSHAYSFDTLFNVTSLFMGQASDTVYGEAGTIFDGFTSIVSEEQLAQDRFRTNVASVAALTNQRGDTIAHYYDSGTYRTFGTSVPVQRLHPLTTKDFVQRVYNFLIGATDVPEFIPKNPFITSNSSLFLSKVVLNIGLPEKTDVLITIYDLSGRKRQVIHNGEMKAGITSISLDGEKFPSGVYFITATARGIGEIGRIKIVKLK